MDEGVVVWVTGPSEGAVARVAGAVREKLVRRRLPVELLAPDTPGLDALAGPGLVRGVAFVASRLVRHGVVVVVAVPAPARAERDAARAALGRMIEVWVSAGGAAAGYEPPERPEVEVDRPDRELGAAVERTLRTLEILGFLAPASDAAYSAEEEREVIRRLKSFGYL